MIKKFNEAFKPLHENVQPVNEAKVDITIPANDAYDMEEEADYIKEILKKAGIDAKCKAGFGEVEIYLKDKGDLKKAHKSIEKAGYTYNADLWFSDAKYFKKSHKIYNLKPKDMIGIGDENMTYADALKKFESANIKESKGFASRELIKATEKLHAEQLKLQDLQNKFVTESDPKKKEKFKKDIIDQHKVVKQVERDFQTTLGREEEDIDDMFESQVVWAPIAESLSELNDKLASDDIDDIMTEIEVAINNMNDKGITTRTIVKEANDVLNYYTKLILSLNRAIAATKK
jgi:hypothetical protein